MQSVPGSQNAKVFPPDSTDDFLAFQYRQSIGIPIEKMVSYDVFQKMAAFLITKAKCGDGCADDCFCGAKEVREFLFKIGIKV